MRICISATNPCYLWPMACELAAQGTLGTYYSGYPRWRLRNSGGVPIRSHPWRTLIVYSLMKWVPERFRPPNRSLFLWQDEAFDKWVASALEPCEFIHAMPGQALHTFRRARQMGVRTVLNHAMGPLAHLRTVLAAEYARLDLDMEKVTPYDEAFTKQINEEQGLADYHCVASTIVREQLIAQGFDKNRIWVVPYGADPKIYHAGPSEGSQSSHSGFRIVYAGQLVVRKGIRFLLDALTLTGREDWIVDFFGQINSECSRDIAAYNGRPKLQFHGAVSQEGLADEFRKGGVLVLPSLEEGFGLVVVQALSCGIPCLVSDQVGAKDLITEERLGAIFPARDAAALAKTLSEWSQRTPSRLDYSFDWKKPSETLTTLSESALCLSPTNNR